MSAAMIRHRANRDFFAYWNRLRAAGAAPEQRLMDPALIGAALPDIFIIDVPEPERYEIRLAGTRLCAFWGRELRGEDALSLWEGQDREGAEMLLFQVIEDAAVAVASHEATSARGERIEMEMVAMPLVRHLGGQEVRRIIGAFVPWSCPYWLGSDPLARQTIASVRLVWPDPDAPAAPPLAATETRRRIASTLARPAPRAAPEPAPRAAQQAHAGNTKAVNGMPVLSRREHLTLLRGGSDEDGDAPTSNGETDG